MGLLYIWVWGNTQEILQPCSKTQSQAPARAREPPFKHPNSLKHTHRAMWHKHCHGACMWAHPDRHTNSNTLTKVMSPETHSQALCSTHATALISSGWANIMYFSLSSQNGTWHFLNLNSARSLFITRGGGPEREVSGPSVAGILMFQATPAASGVF